MNIQVPRKTSEFELVETMPPVAAAATYDMEEQMYFLFVNVVKAKDLPVMGKTGSLDPYVEVKVGNHKGVTKQLGKNQNPVWNSVFAFSKDRIQSNLIEVTVKHKDTEVQNDFVGQIVFDTTKVPLSVSPESSPAPQWYKLEDKVGQKVKGGEIMLAVWMGTQADEAFPGAWHSDAHSVSQQTLANTRSKVYFSPQLYYLRIHVIEAQDLVPAEKGMAPVASVRIEVGSQVRATKPAQTGTYSPVWNEELMFVVAEPFDEYIIISVDSKGELIGRLFIAVRQVPQRGELLRLPDARWFNLYKPSVAEEESEKKKEIKLSSKIHLRICIDTGYHVLDESPDFISDLQPSSKHLRKPSIGILELGFLSARNLPPMKSKDGSSTDAYCVAKYGNKWVRTRTIFDTLTPRWNELYTWEVYDLCTVLTIGAFDNSHINGSKKDARDERIGKIRIRISTIEIGRVYTHYYLLLVLLPSGLKKNGELHLALRFTCTDLVNMVAQYGRPLLPKSHYCQPILDKNIYWLRHGAMQIVAASLSRAEPPLRRETMEYMLDVTLKRETMEYMLDINYHIFSLRRSKANFRRIMSLLSAVRQFFSDICHWKNPLTTIFVQVLFFIQVRYPAYILPNIFLCFFVIGLWNYRFRPREPLHLDAELFLAQDVDEDELDEEFDTFPTSRPIDEVKMSYTCLRSIAGWIQSVAGDVATQGERVLSMLSWKDPRATVIFIIFLFFCSVVFYHSRIQVAQLIGLYMLRHPLFRSKLPSVAANFFNRMPARSDMLL